MKVQMRAVVSGRSCPDGICSRNPEVSGQNGATLAGWSVCVLWPGVGAECGRTPCRVSLNPMIPRRLRACTATVLRAETIERTSPITLDGPTWMLARQPLPQILIQWVKVAIWKRGFFFLCTSHFLSVERWLAVLIFELHVLNAYENQYRPLASHVSIFNHLLIYGLCFYRTKQISALRGPL